MDELLQRVAEIKGMPASLVERSAKARAEKTGTTLEAVLREWAGESTAHVPPSGGTAEERSDDAGGVSEPASRPATEPDTPAEVTIDSLVALAADAKRMPAKLILSSATARAEHSDSSLEEVLADWAGIEQVTGDRSQETEEEQVAGDRSQETEEEQVADVEVIEASSVVPPEPPEPPEEGDAAPLVRGGYPRWLAAAFVLIPLIAVIYILIAPNGPDCGSASQLLVDPVTGQAVDCDGSEYGVAAVDFFADGAALYTQCAACHAGDGTGGAGVAFIGGGLLSTFPGGSCDEQIEFIRLGTAGWPDPIYGATEKPVGGFGLMPTFGGTMTDEQLAAVALYERVEFGGQPLEEAELDCGLDEGEGSPEAAGS
ncbi:MAG: cytochrome c [Acidimicrobiia bacterium]